MKMKKAFAALALLLAAALLAACGAPASSSVPAASSAPAPQESAVEGTITDATMNTLTLETASGNTYLFGTEGVPVAGEGIVLGATAVVYYTGNLVEGADEMQGVTVTRIEVAEAAGGTVEGVVTDATMNTLQIKTDDGTRYIFSTMDAEVDAGSQGLLVGDEVEVTYTGVLDSAGADMQNVTVTLVKVTQAPESTLEGVVTDATMNTLEVRADNGASFLFGTAGASIKTGPNGLIIGDRVRVYYEGEIDPAAEQQQNVTVERIVVTQEPAPQAAASSSAAPASSSKPAASSAPAASSSAPAPASSAAVAGDPTQTLPPPPQPHMVSGTVSDMTMNTLTIEAADGSSLLFSIQDITVEAGTSGVVDGDAVAVYYTGTLAAGEDMQPVAVTKVAVTGWGGNILNGTVTDATMNTVTVQLEDGSTAIFGTEDADVEGGPGGLAVGSAVSVHFLGRFDAANTGNVQDVTVVQVLVQ